MTTIRDEAGVVLALATSTIFGSSEPDLVPGGSNDELVFGLGGDDGLFGSGGDDSLFGGRGNDLLNGGSDSDRLYGDNDDDRGFGGDQDDHLFGGSGADLLYGDGDADSLRGDSADDSLFGGAGNDRLFGGAGDDRLEGGNAKDRFVGGSGSDVVTGGKGNDLLNGGSGIDFMSGGVGNDTYVIDDFRDIANELLGEGDRDVARIDTTFFQIADDEFLGKVEVLIANETAGNALLIGNNDDNTILGNEGDNRILGLGGDDIMNGRGGTDGMLGRLGDDTFVVDTATDAVEERADEGNDLVRAEVSYTLPDGGARDFVENLRLQGGVGAIAGGGNGLDNSLQGNEADNDLHGFRGDDRLSGGSGDDRLFGGLGFDRLEGQSGDDTLVLRSGDVAFGGAGEDSFRFTGESLGEGGSGGPVIRDFDGAILGAGKGADKLVFLTGVERGTFAYIGGQAFSAAGNSEARFAGSRQVQVDQDGDGESDIAFLVDGLSEAGGLTAGDFLFL